MASDLEDETVTLSGRSDWCCNSSEDPPPAPSLVMDLPEGAVESTMASTVDLNVFIT